MKFLPRPYLFNHFQATFFCVVGVLLFSCQPDSDKLHLSDSVINASALAGSEKVLIESNGRWRLKGNDPWLQINATAGYDAMHVTITWTANNLPRQRTTVVEVSDDDETKLITVNQQASPIQGVKSAYKPGNRLLGVQDSVLAWFDRPVIVKNIFSRYKYCLSDNIDWEGSEPNVIVRFNYQCGYLGGRFPLTVDVEDKEGYRLAWEFDALFYDDRVDTEGLINSTCYDETSKLFWVGTHIPYSLLAISLESWQVVKKIELSYNPVNLHISPYNGKLYVTDRTNYIHVLDTVSGAEEYNINTGITQSIEQVVFTKNGKGVMLGSGQVRMIDAAHQDTTYSYIGSMTPTPQANAFSDVYLNSTKDKLLMVDLTGTAEVTVIDPKSNAYKMIRPMGFSSTHWLAPHQKYDFFFIARLKNLGLSDLDGNSSSLIVTDSDLYGNGDFNYGSANPKEFFYADRSNFAMLDMSTGLALAAYDGYGLEGLTCTLDGKYLLGYVSSVKAVYKFSTRWLKPN